MGKILAEQFEEGIKQAKLHDVQFYNVEDEATGIERTGISYDVMLKSGQKVKADYIVLALGHIPSTTYPQLFHCKNYIRNPWLIDVSEIPTDAKIAVIGLGPTAVDTIIKLRDNGTQKVVAYSRSGAMQYPRPIPVKFEPKIVTEDNIRKIATTCDSLRLDTLLGMLAAEFMLQGVDWSPFLAAVKVSKSPPLEALRHGYANCNKPSDWFGLVASLTKCIPIVWHLLDDSERQKFRRMKDEIGNVLYGMAPSHALRMLTELEHKNLEVFGGLVETCHDETAGQFRLSRKEHDRTVSDFVDYCIDCTGFGTILEHSETPLLNNLLARGFLKPHSFGGAIVDFYTGQVAKVDNGRALNIYCLTGTLNIGTRLATNGLGEVASSARRTAQAIHSRFDGADYGSIGPMGAR